jgi:hypothetical protein
VRDIAQTIEKLPTLKIPQLIAPAYVPETGSERNIALVVESMRRHMSDEGWQIMEGLEDAGYSLYGKGMEGRYNLTDVEQILIDANPSTLILQDKREWDVRTRDFRDPEARFTHVGALAHREDIFKLTVLKDSHQQPYYHRESAVEIGCHAWIIYYHPQIVHHLASYTRPQHLIRTYHTIDPQIVPDFDSVEYRDGALLSGAVSRVYPLRDSLINGRNFLPRITYLQHPGYHRNGCCTPDFMKVLSRHRVSICTSSIYGYSLRKLIEATACGCIVLTDLPTDEVLPEIDGNLVRIDASFSPRRVGGILKELYASYDYDKQRMFAEKAKKWYNYRVVCQRLADDIEALRKGYNALAVYS